MLSCASKCSETEANMHFVNLGLSTQVEGVAK